MEKSKDDKTIISIDLDDDNEEEDIGSEENSSSATENLNSQNENTGIKRSYMTRAVKEILNNNSKNKFDPELSNRERRKLNRKFVSEWKNDDSNGSSEVVKDLCDCLVKNCPGCHFPCPRCRSCKCAIECRVNRKWMYESVENETQIAARGHPSNVR